MLQSGCTAVGAEEWFCPATGARFRFIPIGRPLAETDDAFHHIIHEDVWRLRTTAVSNRIMALCGQFTAVHGRQCTVRRIEKPAAEDFLNRYHVGGYVAAYYKLGLYKKDELLAVATFSKGRLMHRDQPGKKSYEMLRFATAGGIQVHGGLSKLIQAFTALTGCIHLMTYADREWTDGRSYERLGFEKTGQTPPLKFMVNTADYNRIQASTWTPDMPGNWIAVSNRGNDKYILSRNA